MKLSACYIVYDDYELLPMSMESIYGTVDKIYFLLNDQPWRGAKRPEAHAKAKEFLKNLCVQFNKCELIEKTFDVEADQRNFGLRISKRDGYKFQLIVDTDEVYNPSELQNLKNILSQNPTLPAVHCTWATYWKTEPLYRIEPREAWNPLIIANVDQFLFHHIRDGLTTDEYGVPNAQYRCYQIPPHILLLHHFSYARDDKYMLDNANTSAHAHEYVKDWYENVWLKWKPEDKNLHPVTPAQYYSAVKQDMNELPPLIKKYFKSDNIIK